MSEGVSFARYREVVDELASVRAKLALVLADPPDEAMINEIAIAIGEVVMRRGTLGEMTRAAWTAARKWLMEE